MKVQAKSSIINYKVYPQVNILLKKMRIFNGRRDHMDGFFIGDIIRIVENKNSFIHVSK